MIKLKPITKNDFRLYQQLYQDEEVVRYVCKPLTESDCKSSFLKLINRIHTQPNKRKCFVIEYKKTQKAVGIIDAKYNPAAMTVEVGILTLPQYHGRGIGTMSHDLLIDEIGVNWPQAKVMARCHENNPAANQLYHKLGFAKNNNKTNKTIIWEKT